MNAELRGLIQELCAIPEVVVNPDYDALRRRADAALSVAQGQGLTGEVVELGDDETGQPRILIHTTREAIKAHAQNLMFRTVVVAAAPAQPDGVGK